MVIRKANPSDAAGIAKVAVNTWRTTYRGIISAEVLAGLSYKQKEKNWHNTLTSGKDIVFVAENKNSDIIGYLVAVKKEEIIQYIKVSYIHFTCFSLIIEWGLVSNF